MGKNHHHKKMLKTEKAKIKLKVKTEKTKFLPKGLNETKTDFKIKPIILPEQLKQKDTLELLSRRKLNVKDILSRLRHHNVTVRHDCLNELKQIISSHIDELASQHLAQVLQGLPPLLLDDNKGVRQTVMTILHKILAQVSASKIKPFFPILSSYLRCSMTNMNRGIQEDSLGFLAILLQCVPEMVADESHKVLPNLFALISKFKVEAKPVRTLSMNLNSKITSVKWHIQVLSGVYGFLKAICIQPHRQSNRTSLVQISASQKASKFVPLIHNSYQNSKISFDNALSTNAESQDVIEKNLSTLIHLLYEIWMEVAPEKDMREFSDFTLLGNDAAAILSCILNVMHLLLQRLVIQNEDNNVQYLLENFFTNECKSFLSSVTSAFPFTKSQDRVKADNSVVQKLLSQYLNTDVKFVRENLLICYLYCHLNKRLVRATQIKDAQRVLTYIDHCLTTRGSINNTNVDCFLLVLRIILFDNIEWHRKVDVEKILIRFVHFYESMYHQESLAALGKSNHNSILDLLCEVSQLSHLNKIAVYQKWLGNISTFLSAKEVSENVVDALLLVGKQCNVEFLAGLRERMAYILGNYDKISVISAQQNQNRDFAKLKILCLFYYIPNLQPSEIDLLRQFGEGFEDDSQEKSMIEYLLHNTDVKH